jgi:hypothetical protein
VYFNFIVKINSSNRKKLQCWWDDSGEYGWAMNMSKNKFSVGSSCNSNNDNFEEMVGWRKMKEKCAGCTI